jgi:N-methylhydantoinase A
MSYRILIDTGGTFTDGVCVDERGRLLTAKSPTTPGNLTDGIMETITILARLCGLDRKELLSRTTTMVNGTTAGTNAVLTKQGAKVGIICTKGFPDVIELRRAPKVDMFDWRMEFPKPLVPRRLRVEVEERINKRGEIVIPLNEDSVHEAVAYLKKQGAEAVVVALLFSFMNDAHEKRVAEIIRKEFPDASCSISSTVLPMVGEFERASTAVIDAYIRPIIHRYIENLRELLVKEGFKGELLFMQNNGGTGTWKVALDTPATLALSGPAAAPCAATMIGGLYGENNILSVDMGGTSYDILIIDKGRFLTKTESMIADNRFSLPVIDVHTIGSGGGSIAWFDVSKTLHVGPKSAGAVPGPACYGRGGEEATVTDANVVLGYISPDYFLGGKMALKRDLAEKAVREKVAKPLGISVVEGAAAIYKIINSTMADGTRQTFTRKGYDPRDFTLCAAGAACPAHAVKIAEDLGISKVLIPKHAPVYCAFGMTGANLKHDYSRFYFTTKQNLDLEHLRKLYEEMESEGLATLEREGVPKRLRALERSMMVRYHGQYREIESKWPSGKINQKTLDAGISAFHDRHKELFGYSDKNYPIDFMTWKSTAVGKVSPPKFKPLQKGTKSAREAAKGKRDAYFEETRGFVKTTVYDGDKLTYGNVLEGPCIIEEKMTTVVIPPGHKLRVGEYGDYLTFKA